MATEDARGAAARAARRLVVIGAAGASMAGAACAETSFGPSTGFVQFGSGEGTHASTAGLTWDWGRTWPLGGGQLAGHWELSLARWSYRAAEGRREAWLGHLGIVPSLRYRPDGGTSRWFAEGGIGAALTSTIYRTEHKRFSTSFNFADHVGVGRNFGTAGEHELTLRFEHFSNAGIKHPNPGANFVELRYAFRFR